MRIIQVLIFSALICTVFQNSGSPKGKLLHWGYLLKDSKLSSHEMKKICNRFDVISVTGARFTGSGTIINIPEFMIKKLRKTAGEKHILIVPHISPVSKAAGIKLLTDKKCSERAVKALQSLVASMNIESLHFDFEYLPEKLSKNYSDFLLKVKNSLKSTTISVALFPPIDFPGNHSGFHNISLLQNAADEFIIMCYDLHNPGTQPGPVTDIRWAKKNLIHILKTINGNSIWLGIPAYGYLWQKGRKAKAISANCGARLSRDHGFTRDTSGTRNLKFRIKGSVIEGGYADTETRIKMESLAREFNLRGTALWRIGFEE